MRWKWEKYVLMIYKCVIPIGRSGIAGNFGRETVARDEYPGENESRSIVVWVPNSLSDVVQAWV